jgi:hypothetical protein
MTEPLPDTWHSRDLPVLRHIVKMCDEAPNDHLHVKGVALELWGRIATQDVERAAAALASGHLIELGHDDGAGFLLRDITEVSGEARRLAGAWPSADNIADRLIAALQDLAEYSDDPVEKTRAKKALEGLGSFSRDTLISVIGAAAGVALQ